MEKKLFKQVIAVTIAAHAIKQHFGQRLVHT